MIRYALTCAEGHDFDSWFASAVAFDRLSGAGQITCAICGAAKVSKALMAPRVTASDKAAAPRPAPPPASDQATPAKAPRPLSAPASPAEAALAALRSRVEAESDYVGLSFAAEARAIHDGDAPARSIYGEARPDEAKRLIEDGVPVAPLPFRPRKHSH